MKVRPVVEDVKFPSEVTVFYLGPAPSMMDHPESLPPDGSENKWRLFPVESLESARSRLAELGESRNERDIWIIHPNGQVVYLEILGEVWVDFQALAATPSRTNDGFGEDEKSLMLVEGRTGRILRHDLMYYDSSFSEERYMFYLPDRKTAQRVAERIRRICIGVNPAVVDERGVLDEMSNLNKAPDGGIGITFYRFPRRKSLLQYWFGWLLPSSN